MDFWPPLVLLERAADVLPLCCLSVVAPLWGGCFSLCCVLVGNYCCQIPALLFSIFSENFSASSEASPGAHCSCVSAWSGAAQGDRAPLLCSYVWCSAATSGVLFPPKNIRPYNHFPGEVTCSDTAQWKIPMEIKRWLLQNLPDLRAQEVLCRGLFLSQGIL